MPVLEARLDVFPSWGGVATGQQREQAAAPLDLVPQHGLQPLPPRISTSSAALLVVAALGLHAGLAVLFAFLLDWRVIDKASEHAIPVEIVAQMPPQTGSDGGTATSLPSSPEAQRGGPSDSSASAKPQPVPPTSATHKLSAPPPEPMRAAAQERANKQANLAPDLPKPDMPEASPPPVQVPQAVAAARGESSVAQPARAEPNPQALPKPAPSGAKPTATFDLSATLPVDFSALPTSFRAVLSGSGAQASQEYKGLVFGRLGRSHQAVERARALHLRGQAYVSFAIDAEGQLTELKIVRSSRIPALDALALDMVREAAPFPPPPSGAKREFAPALAFGED